MHHTDFALRVLEELKNRLGPIKEEPFFRELYSVGEACEVRPDLVVDIVQMVASRYNCDFTQPFSRHDLDKLAQQLAVIFVSFARAHARTCPTCDNRRAAAVVLNRFVNTYVVKHLCGRIPEDIPLREQLFFLDEDSDYTEPDNTSHGLSGDALREAIKNWNVTGNN